MINNRVFFNGMSVRILQKTLNGVILERPSGETFQTNGYTTSLPSGFPVMVYGVMEVWELRRYYPGMENDQDYVISWYDFNPWEIEESKEFSL